MSDDMVLSVEKKRDRTTYLNMCGEAILTQVTEDGETKTHSKNSVLLADFGDSYLSPSDFTLLPLPSLDSSDPSPGPILVTRSFGDRH